MRLTFAKRGRRRKAGYGLYYRSACGRYDLYRSNQVAGVRLPERWLAIAREPTPHLISRHRKRGPAMAACDRHARRKAEVVS